MGKIDAQLRVLHSAIYMKSMPNSWPILMKFGLETVFGEKTIDVKYRPDRTTKSDFAFGYLYAILDLLF